MTYKTVFDAAHQGHAAFAFPAFGLFFIAIGVLLLTKPKWMQQMIPNSRRSLDPQAFGLLFLLFACVWTLIGFFAILGQHQAGAAALQRPFDVVEGTVTNFVPMPYEGHKMESFEVGGRRFSYSDYILTPGFHNTASHGGPIKPGLHVRLSYAGNDILRIEVAE
jgi:hypothetical protein